jgi:hypothetical protein
LLPQLPLEALDIFPAEAPTGPGSAKTLPPAQPVLPAALPVVAVRPGLQTLEIFVVTHGPGTPKPMRETWWIAYKKIEVSRSASPAPRELFSPETGVFAGVLPII